MGVLCAEEGGFVFLFLFLSTRSLSHRRGGVVWIMVSLEGGRWLTVFLEGRGNERVFGEEKRSEGDGRS